MACRGRRGAPGLPAECVRADRETANSQDACAPWSFVEGWFMRVKWLFLRFVLVQSFQGLKITKFYIGYSRFRYFVEGGISVLYLGAFSVFLHFVSIRTFYEYSYRLALSVFVQICTSTHLLLLVFVQVCTSTKLIIFSVVAYQYKYTPPAREPGGGPGRERNRNRGPSNDTIYHAFNIMRIISAQHSFRLSTSTAFSGLKVRVS